jgi:glutamate decarboxylase
MAADYPLPMNESDTEILRVVVRESMAMDLLDRLIADIFTVTESLVKIEGSFDIAEWEAFPKKASSSRGTDDLGRRLTARKFPEGHAIYKSVC